MKKKTQKPYDQMTHAELAEATKIFDGPVENFLPGRPLNAKERALWNAAKSKGGRPRVGQGVKVISLSMERSLLKRADARAKAEGITRAQLIARGLQAIL